MDGSAKWQLRQKEQEKSKEWGKNEEEDRNRSHKSLTASHKILELIAKYKFDGFPGMHYIEQYRRVQGHQ